MRYTLCIVSKFILIFVLQCQTQMFHFEGKKRGLWQGCPGGGEAEMKPYLALSVFIWHYYSPGNKFWHVKISGNSNIKCNQWRLLFVSQKLGPLIVPKSKPMGLCIIVRQRTGRELWPRSFMELMRMAK